MPYSVVICFSMIIGTDVFRTRWVMLVERCKVSIWELVCVWVKHINIQATLCTTNARTRFGFRQQALERVNVPLYYVRSRKSGPIVDS